MNSARKPARWPLILATVLSAAAIATLFWLRARLVEEEQTQLANAQRVFEQLVLRPENDALNFSTIEANAVNFRESSDLIAELYVSKATVDDGEVLVHPYYFALLNPSWKDHVSTWQRLPLGPESNPNGWLYINVVASNRRAVDRTIGLFAAFLVVCLTVLVFRTRGKELELGRTVSELEQRKAEVIRLERLALAGQLSANIFHDIKKPVLNIKHELHDLLEQRSLDPAMNPSLQAMQEQTDLFLKMLRELGFEQFVRAEREESEFCDIPQMIERSLALVKYEQDDVEVTTYAHSEALPLVFAPPHRLILLFSNLILNAYQAMGEKGSLEISVAGSGSAVTISFKDKGPGVPPEIRSTIFAPFVTTKSESEGSGLGLYICSQIARDLGGILELKESSPSGTTFEVRLPGSITK